jgi:hypothetical protein
MSSTTGFKIVPDESISNEILFVAHRTKLTTEQLFALINSNKNCTAELQRKDRDSDCHRHTKNTTAVRARYPFCNSKNLDFNR